MDFLDVLSRSWKIIWKHKVLWIFGILASCGQGGGGGGNSSYRGGNGGDFPGGDFFGGNIPPAMQEAITWVQDNLVVVIVSLVCFAILMTVITVVVSTIGRIGLIHGAYRSDQDETSTYTFGDLFGESRRYFWRIFWLDFIVGLITFLIIFLVIGGGLAIAYAGGGFSGNEDAMGAAMGGMTIILVLCLCCVFVPIGIVVNAILEMAYRAIVVDDHGIRSGFSRGWEVLKANLGSFVVMWLILAIGSAIVGFVLALPFIAAIAPIMIGVMAGEGAAQTGITIGIICGCLYLPVLLVLNGILQSFVHSAWTLTYLRFTDRPAGGGVPSQAVVDLPL